MVAKNNIIDMEDYNCRDESSTSSKNPLSAMFAIAASAATTTSSFSMDRRAYLRKAQSTGSISTNSSTKSKKKSKNKSNGNINVSIPPPPPPPQSSDGSPSSSVSPSTTSKRTSLLLSSPTAKSPKGINHKTSSNKKQTSMMPTMFSIAASAAKTAAAVHAEQQQLRQEQNQQRLNNHPRQQQQQQHPHRQRQPRAKQRRGPSSSSFIRMHSQKNKSGKAKPLLSTVDEVENEDTMLFEKSSSLSSLISPAESSSSDNNKVSSISSSSSSTTTSSSSKRRLGKLSAACTRMISSALSINHHTTSHVHNNDSNHHPYSVLRGDSNKIRSKTNGITFNRRAFLQRSKSMTTTKTTASEESFPLPVVMTSPLSQNDLLSPAKPQRAELPRALSSDSILTTASDASALEPVVAREIIMATEKEAITDNLDHKAPTARAKLTATPSTVTTVTTTTIETAESSNSETDGDVWYSNAVANTSMIGPPRKELEHNTSTSLQPMLNLFRNEEEGADDFWGTFLDESARSFLLDNSCRSIPVPSGSTVVSSSSSLSMSERLVGRHVITAEPKPGAFLSSSERRAYGDDDGTRIGGMIVGGLTRSLSADSLLSMPSLAPMSLEASLQRHQKQQGSVGGGKGGMIRSPSNESLLSMPSLATMHHPYDCSASQSGAHSEYSDAMSYCDIGSVVSEDDYSCTMIDFGNGTFGHTPASTPSASSAMPIMKLVIRPDDFSMPTSETPPELNMNAIAYKEGTVLDELVSAPVLLPCNEDKKKRRWDTVSPWENTPSGRAPGKNPGAGPSGSSSMPVAIPTRSLDHPLVAPPRPPSRPSANDDNFRAMRSNTVTTDTAMSPPKQPSRSTNYDSDDDVSYIEDDVSYLDDDSVAISVAIQQDSIRHNIIINGDKNITPQGKMLNEKPAKEGLHSQKLPPFPARTQNDSDDDVSFVDDNISCIDDDASCWDDDSIAIGSIQSADRSATGKISMTPSVPVASNTSPVALGTLENHSFGAPVAPKRHVAISDEETEDNEDKEDRNANVNNQENNNNINSSNENPNGSDFVDPAAPIEDGDSTDRVDIPLKNGDEPQNLHQGEENNDSTLTIVRTEQARAA